MDTIVYTATDSSGNTATCTFTVTVMDSEGCSATANVTVVIDEVGNIYIPNVFNRSSLAGNNLFFVQGETGQEALVDMTVYDRWGNLVFESYDAPINQPEYGWDGSYNGSFLNSGVYLYMATVKISNGAEIMLSGDVTFLK